MGLTVVPGRSRPRRVTVPTRPGPRPPSSAGPPALPALPALPDHRRAAAAARPAPAALSSTSSTEDTRPSANAYCRVSTTIDAEVASATITATRRPVRSAAANPNAAKTSRLPTNWKKTAAGPPAGSSSRSTSGMSRTSRGASSGVRVIQIQGSVPPNMTISVQERRQASAAGTPRRTRRSASSRAAAHPSGSTANETITTGIHRCTPPGSTVEAYAVAGTVRPGPDSLRAWRHDGTSFDGPACCRPPACSAPARRPPAAEPPSPPAPGDLLVVDTEAGLGVVDVRDARLAVAPAARAAAWDGRVLAGAVVGADGARATRVTVLSVDGRERFATTVDGELMPRVVAAGGHLVALTPATEQEAASPYRPAGRESTTIVVAGTDRRDAIGSRCRAVSSPRRSPPAATRCSCSTTSRRRRRTATASVCCTWPAAS